MSLAPGEEPTLTAATDLHARRRFARALVVGRAVVAREPNNGLAWLIVGSSALELGQADEALPALERAVELAPEQAAAHAALGAVFRDRHDWPRAAHAFGEAVRLAPHDHAARESLAETLLRLERYADAERHLRHVVERQASWSAVAHLGRALMRQGRAAEAISWLQRAVKERPDAADVHTDLGVIRAAEGRLEQAASHFARAARLDPRNAGTHRNWGMTLRAMGDLGGAAAALGTAIKAGDTSPETYEALVAVLVRQGRLEEALPLGQEAVRRNPHSAIAQSSLGALHMEAGRVDEAAGPLRTAVSLDPRWRPAHINAMFVESQLGDVEEARRHGEAALVLEASDGLRARLAMLLPPIYSGCQAVEDERTRFSQAIEALGERELRISDPLTEVGATSFFLAYQGRNDRDLQAQVAKLYRFLPTQVPLNPRRASRRRVGFISRYLTPHPVSHAFSPLITALGNKGLDVVLLYPEGAGHPDWAPRKMAKGIPPALPAARQAIARERLDVLVYLDIGMDPFTYFLSFTRLAPVQCVLGGHPVTTGIPAIDYFVSHEGFELPDAEAHYTERLVKLKGVPSHYVRPPMPPPLSRAELGLAEDRTLYVCPLMLQKLHPDMDHTLGEILRRDPKGDVILFRTPGRLWHERLLSRLRRTIPDVVDRVRFLDHLPTERFLCLLRVSDVVLDTFHFGAGTTSYMVLAMETPIVSLPGAFLRGRAIAGLSALMGFGDLVARDPEDYAARAVRLGCDHDFRAHVCSQIAARFPGLCEDRLIVDEMARFFSEVRPPSGT